MCCLVAYRYEIQTTDRFVLMENNNKGEDKIKGIFEELFDGLFITSRSGKILDANSKGVKMLGYDSKDEVLSLDLGKDIYAYPPDRKRILSMVNAQGTAEYEMVVKKKSGEAMITHCALTAVKDERGRVTSYRGVIRDVTIQKQIQDEAIRVSEEKHRILFLESPDAYLILAEGVFVDCNHSAEAMLRGNRSLILGLSPESISPEFQPDGRKSSEVAKQNIKQAFDSGSQTFEWVHRRLDGSDFFVEVSIAPMMLEGKQALFTTWRDVTMRKQVEMALLSSEARLRTLVQTIPDLIWLKNKDGVYLSCNTMFERFFGAKEVDIVGKTDYDFVSKELADFFRENDRKAMEAGQPTSNEEWINFADDGRLAYLETIKTPMYDARGALLGVIGIGRDITTRNLLDAEIKLKNEELLKLNLEKDKFFSILAHDLRSPFSSFLGITEILAENSSVLTSEEIQWYALRMKDSATSLFRLLENLLQWASIQQGVISINKKLIKLRPIVDENIAFVLEPAKNKGVEMTYDVSYDLEVFADSNMLQTIIRNLVSNAVKYTTQGGKVSLSVNSTRDGGVEFAIKDTGIGMSSAMVNNLFRLDVQTNRKGTDGEPSTGLGLLLCKEFVGKHGGKIWVESEEGKGTTFYFTIPYSKDDV